MAEIRLRVCDRCGNDAGDRTSAATTPLPTQRLTRHGHHDRFIDLCASCAASFDEWMAEMGPVQQARREGVIPRAPISGSIQPLHEGLGGVGPALGG